MTSITLSDRTPITHDLLLYMIALLLESALLLKVSLLMEVASLFEHASHFEVLRRSVKLRCFQELRCNLLLNSDPVDVHGQLPMNAVAKAGI
jgi:hypothetical protein